MPIVVERHLPLSLNHLSLPAFQFLTALPDTFRSIESADGGLAVHVPDDIPDDTPRDLADLLCLAADMGCSWIEFDHAGPVYEDDLPLFDDLGAPLQAA